MALVKQLPRDETLLKIPPQSLEAEESVLSSCLLGGYQDAVDMLVPEDFYRTSHQHIFQAVCDLSARNAPVDIVTVGEALKSSGKFDEVGGMAPLSRLIDTIPASTSLEYHCQLIKGKSVLRQVIAKSSEIIGACYGGESPEAVLDSAQTELLKLDFGKKSKTVSRINEIIGDCIDQIEACSKTRNRVTGIPTGLAKFDTMTAGLQFRELTILAARPSMGKTAMAMQIAKNACQNGFPTMVFSIEMGKNQLGIRLIASESRVEHTRVRIGYLNSGDWERIAGASAEISELKLHIDDDPQISISELRRRVRQAVKTHGIRLIVVDYLQLMEVDRRNKRLDVEYGTITKGIKALAKEYNLATLILSQLNRKLEERSDKRPQLSDLRESGAIEQDADLVAFIYRDEVYNKDENNPLRGTAELIVAKQRNGPTGVVPLTFIGPYMRFENPA